MTTRRKVTELVEEMFKQYYVQFVHLEKMTPAFTDSLKKQLAEFIQDWLDEDQSGLILKENTDLYVCKLSSTNVHTKEVVGKGMGFSFLKKGDAFDFDSRGFGYANGEGRIYQATSDFKNGRICADERYNPEI